MSEKQLVIVFTMGRVGSSATFEALDAALPGADVVHVHSLNPLALSKALARDRVARSTRDAVRVRERLDSTDDAVRVVTLVRDAIARNMSAAFANYRRTRPQGVWDADLEDAEKMASFWETFHHKQPLVWYDNQMLAGLGVDVYDHPRPLGGSCQFVAGRFELLVMRSELSDPDKSAVLSGAFNEAVNVGIVGDSQEQAGADLYRRFRQSAPLTEEYVRGVARSRYMQHFYETDEAEYLARWL